MSLNFEIVLCFTVAKTKTALNEMEDYLAAVKRPPHTTEGEVVMYVNSAECKRSTFL